MSKREGSIDLSHLVSLVALGVMGNSAIYVMPLLVGGMTMERGFSAQQAGLVASADLAGFAVATFIVSFLVNRVSWRRLAWAGLLFVFGANAVTTATHDFATFAAVRFASGLGAGTLVAIATVALGRSDRPDRYFGILFAAALGFASVALWGLPFLFERYGLNAAYWLMAALTLACAAGVPALPDGQSAGHFAARSATLDRHTVLVALVLSAVLVFFAEQNAVWAYAERIGHDAGLESRFVGLALGLANFAGLGGALLVAWLGARAGRVGPLIAATGVQIVALFLLRNVSAAPTYLIANASLAFAWNVVNPFQLGVLA